LAVTYTSATNVTTIDRFALVTPSSDGPMMRMLQVDELKRAMGHKGISYVVRESARKDSIAREWGMSACNEEGDTLPD